MSGVDMPGDTKVRSQGNSISVNTDGIDFEDYVDRLAVLVYDAKTEQLVKASFVHSTDFVLGIPVTQETMKLHFCFIANFPESWGNTLLGIKQYSGLKQTLQLMEPFRSRDGGKELYYGATKGSYFPMSRIYENNTVWAAQPTTPKDPQLFSPTTSGDGSLKPISSFTTNSETGKDQSSVNLIRTAAKISLHIIGTDDVERVVMQNIKPVHSYMEPNVLSNYPSDQLIRMEFQGCGPGGDALQDGTCHTHMYVPEILLGESGPNLYWDSYKKVPLAGTGISYITIVMKDGSHYNIPIISNDIESNEYLDIAYGQKGEENKPNFSVIRNHEYKFEIIVPPLKSDLEIKVHYEVKPWDVQKIEIPFD